MDIFSYQVKKKYKSFLQINIKLVFGVHNQTCWDSSADRRSTRVLLQSAPSEKHSALLNVKLGFSRCSGPSLCSRKGFLWSCVGISVCFCVCFSKAGPHETADTFSPSLSCCAENVNLHSREKRSLEDVKRGDSSLCFLSFNAQKKLIYRSLSAHC